MPAFADGTPRHLEPGWIDVERFVRLLRGVFLLLLAGLAWMILAAAGTLTGTTLWLAGAAVLVLVPLVLSLAVVLPRYEHARAGWRVLPDRVEAWRGLFWRHRTSVPISRVQYVDVRQGPVQRRAGIATLVIHTAGTVAEAVDLPGLAPDLAAEVRDWLVAQTGSDAV